MTYDKSNIVFEPLSSHPNFKDITHQRFNYLTVLGYAGSGRQSKAMWWCECDCGNITKLVGIEIRNGHTRSCGHCSLVHPGRTPTHGMTLTRAWSAWHRLKQRCLNPKKDNFEDYGGRGIKVCDRWLNSFENFYEDMGDPPSPQHTIERIDVNGDYCPENCKWLTMQEQQRNKRTAPQITFQGVTKPLITWCEELHLSYGTIYARIHHHGWTHEEALTIPLRQRRGRP